MISLTLGCKIKQMSTAVGICRGPCHGLAKFCFLKWDTSLFACFNSWTRDHLFLKCDAYPTINSDWFLSSIFFLFWILKSRLQMSNLFRKCNQKWTFSPLYFLSKLHHSGVAVSREPPLWCVQGHLHIWNSNINAVTTKLTKSLKHHPCLLIIWLLGLVSQQHGCWMKSFGKLTCNFQMSELLWMQQQQRGFKAVSVHNWITTHW